MPTMQEIDNLETLLGKGSFGPLVKLVCAAARRGVEADAEIAQIAKQYLKRAPCAPSSVGPEQQSLSSESVKRATTSHVWRAKQRSRKRE